MCAMSDDGGGSERMNREACARWCALLGVTRGDVTVGEMVFYYPLTPDGCVIPHAVSADAELWYPNPYHRIEVALWGVEQLVALGFIVAVECHPDDAALWSAAAAVIAGGHRLEVGYAAHPALATALADMTVQALGWIGGGYDDDYR